MLEVQYNKLWKWRQIKRLVLQCRNTSPLIFSYKSHVFRRDAVANINDLLGQSESFGSLTIDRGWKWTLPHSWATHLSAASLHNVTAICFHSLAKCADVTTIAAYNRAMTLNKFPGEEPNDILSQQEIWTTFLSLQGDCFMCTVNALDSWLNANTYVTYFST